MIYCTTAEQLLPQLNNIKLLLTDPPYGQNWTDWDKSINTDNIWQLIEGSLATDAYVIMTAQQPFASKLIHSSPLKFRQELIWEKPNGTGQVRYGPNRVHENILIWYTGHPPYNPQMTEGTPYTWNSTRSKGETSIHKNTDVINNTGTRHPRSVQKVKQERGLHPTQKPTELFEWLIQSYSNPGDLVCDPYLGSGTTAIAAENTGRQFVGCEQNIEYCDVIKKRLRERLINNCVV